MFVTQEILERRGACQAGRKWFARHYPNGAEMLDVINHPKVSTEFLYWGYGYLRYNEQELEAYLKKLNIQVEKPHTIFKSDNVINSEFIMGCSFIQDSAYVFKSQNVENSENLVYGNHIKNSKQCFNSSFCFDAEKVLSGTNINNSSYIINSQYIINSFSVVNGINIVESGYVGDYFLSTENITNSFFIAACKNLKNCLFCAEISKGENLLFNKPISEQQIKMIKEQLLTILKQWRTSIIIEKDWPERDIPLTCPQPQISSEKQYSALPSMFWDWVKTLPNYDPQILYRITAQPFLLEKN